MNTNTITQVSKSLGISTRMLRYYEQVGLISSYKKDDYAYRMYDENMPLDLLMPVREK
ncbi:MAG: MerR family transcriptional regulator [Anaerorhabdus sp.]|uniref:helix-turn-helix domain-containing protein n=1 Tax=Anaerorhabdus sp. TaxID=1872524 RepID=UPI002FCB5C11